MISFKRFVLDNGLTVIFHHDPTTPMAVVNTLYDVGARDEDPKKTGFAHLFEHLMFGGSVNIPDFDKPLQMAGGESNAFTSNDITNYYDTIPSYNLDTALWLESDRMLSLAFTDKSLDVQRQVVIEEFKQRYLNQPYGDVWLNLRPIAYKEHPYKWATIGKEIKHIEDASMDDVKSFFAKHYSPQNAILCIAGNFNYNEVYDKVNHWYGGIDQGVKYKRDRIIEPIQNDYREKTIKRAVPANAFYYVFKMSKRDCFEFYIGDLISDVLGASNSSVLQAKLKKEKRLVTQISAYITGSIDQGLLVISGNLSEGVRFEQLDDALWSEIANFSENLIEKETLDRLKIKNQTAREFQEQGLLNRAMNLSYFELLGDAQKINEEKNLYDKIDERNIQVEARKILVKSNCSLLKVKTLDYD
tara:strand:+ start:7828 stop:9072 length:1245 start_codon:yes stop_codon:yes gene_type:complete